MKRPASTPSGSVDPLGLDPVRPQRLDLLAQVLSLLAVGGEPEAAERTERVARETCHLGELGLRPAPQRERTVPAVIRDDLVVGAGHATERESAVAAARALGHTPLVDDADAEAGLGERERARAARDAGADDADVDRPAVAGRQRGSGLVQPVGSHRAIVLRTTPSSTATTPASSSSTSAAATAPAGSDVARTSSSGVAAPSESASTIAAAPADVGDHRRGRDRLDADRLEDVRRARHRSRALPQEAVRPGAQSTRDLSGDDENLAPVLEREVRGDQRA